MGISKNRVQKVVFSLLLAVALFFLILAIAERVRGAEKIDPFNMNLYIALFVALGPVSLLGLLTQKEFGDEIREGAKDGIEDVGKIVIKSIETRNSENMNLFLTSMKQTFQSLIDETKENCQYCVKQGERAYDKIARLHEGLVNLGIDGAFSDRAKTLKQVEEWIDVEGGKNAEIVLVGTSLRGVFFDDVKGSNRDIMIKIAQKIEKSLIEPKNVKILLTHPAFAFLREEAETAVRPGLASTSIRKEILESVLYILDFGIPEECIHFYIGTPTLFGVKTSQWMLINPYPYQSESFKSFAFTVKRISTDPYETTTIWGAYSNAHFNKAWEGKNAVPYVHTDFDLYWDSGTEGFLKLGKDPNGALIDREDRYYKEKMPKELRKMYNDLTPKLNHSRL